MFGIPGFTAICGLDESELRALDPRPGAINFVGDGERLEYRAPRPSPHTDEWFQTFTGLRVNLNDFRPENVCVTDILHSLPGITRFGAQARRLNGYTYTVGEHSCLIAWYARHMLRLPPSCVKLALMHDAPEAYTGDIKRPIKNARPEIRAIVKHVENVTMDVLGLPREKPDWLRELDERIIVDEKDALMCRPADGTLWSHERIGLKGLGVPIRCLPPDTVEAWMYSIWMEVKDA